MPAVRDLPSLSLRLEESYANDPKVRAIVCPIDGEYGGRHNDGVHFDEPTYTTTDDYLSPDGSRGSFILVPCWCEGGHRWLMVIAFHEGQVFVSNRAHPEGTDIPGYGEDVPGYDEDDESA